VKEHRKKRLKTVVLLFFCLLFITACAKQEEEAVQEKKNTGFVGADTGVFDSADTAVIADVDLEEKTVTLKNMEIKKQYTLNYDGTTYFYDKYGKQISVMQLEKGEIADVTFFKVKKRLNSLQLSDTAWCHENISEYKLDEEKLQAEIGSVICAYTDDIVVISDGEQGDIIDINPVDTLTFRGVGTDLYSIVIEKGHGYVRLKNEEYFYGGWIEIGNKTIQKVSENMLLTVPEGEHQVVISNKGTSGVKQITVRKDMELELDVGDLKGAEPKYGTVIFTVTPEDALLYLDGEKTDHTSPVRLEYGIHQMIVMKDGYETVTQYLKVGQESAGIEVTMKTREGVSGNDPSESNGTISNELLDEVNKILQEKGYDKISASDLEGYGTTGNAPANTDTGTGTNTNTGTNTGTGTGTNPTDTNSNNSGGNNAVTSTLSYYVTIDAPAGAEIYLDGNYVGIAPCSFKKEAGSHTLTLRKTGYMAKSYTIQVDNEEKNISYSFLDLIPIE